MQDTLQLGNLDAKRDWGFAGDYVVGMWKMLQLEEPSDFVLATGEAHSVREFCELCFAEVDMPLEWRGAGEEERGYDPQGKLRVEIDRKYFRPAEVDCLVGDATKARQLLEWSPTVSFEELATMMVQSDLALAESDLASEMTPTDIL